MMENLDVYRPDFAPGQWSDTDRHFLDAFATNPEWLAARAETEKDGQIVAQVTNEILAPTSFSSVK